MKYPAPDTYEGGSSAPDVPPIEEAAALVSAKPLPARMRKALAELKAAWDALPPLQLPPVACPIFGNAIPPIASLTAGVPPQLAHASAQLAAALASPPSLSQQWPFANPAAAQAAIQAQATAAGGRPTQVQPHQVVRLARCVRLGDSKRAAAKKVGLKWNTALRVLAGQHPVAHDPAVTATGLHLPPLKKKGGAA